MLVVPHTLNFFFSKIDFIMVCTIVFSLRDPKFYCSNNNNITISCTNLVTHGSKLVTPSALLGALAVAKAPKPRRPRNPPRRTVESALGSRGSRCPQRHPKWAWKNT